MGLCPKPRSLANGGEWLQGKRAFPGARFPFWEPIAPSGLLGLLSSRALSVPAVARTRNIGGEVARAIGERVNESSFAQINFVQFCSARYTNFQISCQTWVRPASGGPPISFCGPHDSALEADAFSPDYLHNRGASFVPGTERELRFTRDGCLMSHTDRGNRCLTAVTTNQAEMLTVPGK